MQVTTVVDKKGYQHIVEVNHGLISGPKGDKGDPFILHASAEECVNIGEAYYDSETGHLFVLDSVLPRHFEDCGQIQGEQGERGPIGPQGEQGPQGERGQDGSDGEQGPEGPQGEPGPQGETGTGITSINYIGPDSEGDRYYRINLSDGTSYVIETDKGDKGDTGPQGIQGIQGLQGEKGDKGDTGERGPRGYQGIQGPQGNTGPQGPQGVQGPQGEVGPRGQIGAKGDKGDTGSQGPKGDSGTNGVGIVSINYYMTDGEGNRYYRVNLSDNTSYTIRCDKGDTGGGIIIKTSPEQCTKVGDGYLDSNGHLWVLTQTTPTYVFQDVGPVQGPQGPQGIQGEQGIQGPIGDPGIYYGTETPTDPDVSFWIDPSGSPEVTLETTANKVTLITSSSTNTQYPSAKAVYDSIQALEIPDNYEIGEVYLGTRAGVESTPDDIHMRIFKNGEPVDTQTFTMELYVTGGGSLFSIGKHEFTTDSSGYVPPLQEINNISEMYIQRWLRGKFSNSSLNVNVYALDRSTLLCSTTVTRNILADHVANNSNYAVLSSAVYNYSEAKSNKETSISSSSTDSQYPSSKAVYDYGQNIAGTVTALDNSLASVAKTGNYNDLINLPNLNQKENVSNKVTTLSAQSTDTQYPSAKATYKILSDVESMLEDTEETVQTWLTYKEDNSNKSQQFRDNTANMVNYPSTIAVTDYVNNKMSGLATVATTGSYNDLIDKPSVPSGQVQSDWNQTNTNEVDYIKNKPDLSLKQDKSDMVQSISSSSLSTEYPSALAVYNYIQSLSIQGVQF